MTNLFQDKSEREFYVWVDEDDPITKHNMNNAGFLFSIPEDKKYDPIPFIDNPKPTGFMSPFIGNAIWSYRTEYNLELARRYKFQKYPSRFLALFLFETIEDAQKYSNAHPWHVGYRSLKKVVTHEDYSYSKHDIGWIDFLLLQGGQDSTLIKDVTDEYWTGASIQGKQLLHHGKPYAPISNYEILYYGWVKPLETIQQGIDA